MRPTTLLAMLFLSIILGVLTLTSALAQNEDYALLNVQFISQTPDPATPGDYVDLRWRVTNLGGQAQDYVFEVLNEYPFSVDANNQVTRSSVVGYQASEGGAVIYFRVRVDQNAIESEGGNVVRLVYYRAGNPSSRTVIEQPIRIESPQGLVDIANVQVDPRQVNAGSPFNIHLELENLGTNQITNVKVTVQSDGNFTPIGGSNQKTISRVAGSSKAVYDFQYFADASAQVRVHSVPIEVSYRDSLGRNATVSTTIGIPVGAQSQYLANIERSEVFMAGQKGQVVLSISNTGRSDINFVVLKLQETDQYQVIGTDTSYLGNLESDDFETGQFDIYVKQGVEPGMLPIKATLSYRDAYDQVHNEELTFSTKLYSAEDAQMIGLLPASSAGGMIFFVVLVVAVIGFFVWRSRRKRKERD